MNGYIQTVTGKILPEQLGKTITHEHLLWDQSCYWQPEPLEATKKKFVHEPVSNEMKHKLYYNIHQNRDNTTQFDVNLAIDEANYFKRAGGNTIVDVTSIGLGRDPSALAEISRITGLNIVMGCGYYTLMSHPQRVREMSKTHIADEIIREFHEGMTYHKIKPGIIGEIGITSIGHEQEIKALRGAAIAQKETGISVSIHPCGEDGGKILDIFEEEGGDVSRVVMCHCDMTHTKTDYIDYIAKRGAFIEFDTFGYDNPIGSGDNIIWLPRDIERIIAIKKQIELGNLSQIVVSHDIAFKGCLVKYGGFGYGHILRDLPVYMNNKGITNQDIDTILIDTPKRLLTITAK